MGGRSSLDGWKAVDDQVQFNHLAQIPRTKFSTQKPIENLIKEDKKLRGILAFDVGVLSGADIWQEHSTFAGVYLS